MKEDKQRQRGNISIVNKYIEKFMDTQCVCYWILVEKEHKKKDCKHYSYFQEKDLIKELIEKFINLKSKK